MIRASAEKGGVQKLFIAIYAKGQTVRIARPMPFAKCVGTIMVAMTAR